MIYPRQNKLIHRVFHHYISFIIRRHFKAVRFNGVQVEAGRSVLLLANHFSWWDGFILYWLNYLVFKKRFHIMIMEDTVRNVFFLKYMGAFSIVKNSRQMLASLQYAGQLLQDPDNLVLIFPQGKLYSNFVDEVDFERGLAKVIQTAGGQLQYVFAATFIENFEHKRPSVYTYLQQHQAEQVSVSQLQAMYGAHYTSAKLQHLQNVV